VSLGLDIGHSGHRHGLAGAVPGRIEALLHLELPSLLQPLAEPVRLATVNVTDQTSIGSAFGLPCASVRALTLFGT